MYQAKKSLDKGGERKPMIQMSSLDFLCVFPLSSLTWKVGVGDKTSSIKLQRFHIDDL